MPTSTSLTRVPVAKRKQLAATLGLFATLFVAVGAVAATGPATVVVRVFVAVALVVAVVLALMAWGVAHSIRDDVAVAADRDLDALIDQALAAAPRKYGSMCNCGHDHDPTEIHVIDELGVDEVGVDGLGTDPAPDACAHDGGGAACSHNCDTCVLAALRPSPSVPRSERQSR